MIDGDSEGSDCNDVICAVYEYNTQQTKEVGEISWRRTFEWTHIVGYFCAIVVLCCAAGQCASLWLDGVETTLELVAWPNYEVRDTSLRLPRCDQLFSPVNAISALNTLCNTVYMTFFPTNNVIQKFFPGFSNTLFTQYNQLRLINIAHLSTIPWLNISNRIHKIVCTVH